MTGPEKVIAVARAELGYKEKASPDRLDDKTANAGSGNYTKYARDLDAVTDFYNGAKQGYAWCDVFVDWCFCKAFGAELAKKLLCQPDKSAGAGCTYSAQYFKNKGQFYTTAPKAGDQIFFGTTMESTHTGLVVKVEVGRVYTVEGNSSNGVFERSYMLEAANICGYGRPDWRLVDGAETPEESTSGSVTVIPPVSSQTSGEASVILPELYKGCVGEAVRAAQLLLIGRGWSCGPDGADGDFGANTRTAVRKYQQLHDLEDDGVIGVNTWTSLLTRK